MRALLVIVGFLAILSTPIAAQKSQASSGRPAASAKSVATPAAPVNLNTATQSQLETLPGIGPKAAQRILDYRQKNGNFKKIEDLMHVKGIGEKSFLKLKPLITVAGDKAERTTGA